MRPIFIGALAIATSVADFAHPASAGSRSRTAETAQSTRQTSLIRFLEQDEARDIYRLMLEGRLVRPRAMVDSILAGLHPTTIAESLTWARWKDFSVPLEPRADTLSLERARNLVALKQRLTDARSDDVAYSEAGMARLLLKASRFDEAWTLLDNAVAIADSAWGPRSRYLAAILMSKGYAEYRLYKREACIRTDEQAVEILDQGGSVDLQLCNALELLAIHLPRDQVTRGIALAERSLALRERYGPHPGLWRALRTIASVRSDHLGDYAEAHRLTERCLEIISSSEDIDSLTVATTKSSLGMLDLELCNYGQAVTELTDAISCFRAISASKYYSMVWIYDWRARALSALGDHVGACSSLDSSLAVDSTDAGTLSLYAKELEALGQRAAAVRMCERALAAAEHWRRTIGDIQVGRDASKAYDILGTIRRSEGNLPEARRLYTLAAAELVADRGEITDVAMPWSHLAAVMTASGDFDSAATLYERIVRVCSAGVGREHPFVSEALADEGLLNITRKDYSRAFPLLLESEDVGREHLQLLFRSLSESQALRYASSRRSAIDPMLWIACETDSVPPNAASRIWDEVIRSRALVLDEMAERRRLIATTRDSSLQRLSADYGQARQRLASLVVKGPGPAGKEAHDELVSRVRDEGDRLEKQLAAASAVFRRLQSNHQVGLRQVANALAPEAALVGYVCYERPGLPGASDSRTLVDRDSAYAAFVLTASDSVPRLIALGSARALDADIVKWRSILSAATSDPDGRLRAVGERIRRTVWDPIAPLLGPARTIYIVPDGAIHSIPFEALPAGKPNEYLIEHAPLFIRLMSERDLVSESHDSPSFSSVLAFGGPDFDHPGLTEIDNLENRARTTLAAGNVYRSSIPVCSDRAGLHFEPLPGTLREIDAILAAVPAKSVHGFHTGTLALRGAQASEAIFKRYAPGSSALHIATHGFVLPTGCSVSGETPADNPLLRCGVALAGANIRGVDSGAGEDGILTAEEVAALDLEGTDTVVLSACETGGGMAMPREGILGLQRALRIAGAGTLIASLWKVEDGATAAWMEEFYRSCRLNGMTATASARRASLRLLARSRSRGETPTPATWASFVVIE